MEVRAALAELVRREVLSVSAGPLSPERGSYCFTQDMLRRVAYDTWSRRDRKTRHLAVAADLRAASPGDGEEPSGAPEGPGQGRVAVT
jgi:predicted ATPase